MITAVLLKNTKLPPVEPVDFYAPLQFFKYENGTNLIR